MGRTLRTFVAFPCAPDVARRLRREAERLAAIDGTLRAPREGAFHLTLQFLGGTSDADVTPISRALAEAVAAVEPVEVAYGGLGAFPVAARARVVWASVREVDGGGVLARLAADVGRRLGRLGFPPEARGWHAHVTLGRLKSLPGPRLVQAVEAGGELDLGRGILSDLKLILSEPGSGGYRYIDLTTVHLGETPGS